jgi:hypothetical protein
VDAHTEPVVEQTSRFRAFVIVKWYGYIISLMFILFGGVKLILGALDRDYSDAPTYVISLIEGLILLGLTMGFRDRKKWGWYGMVGMNGLFVLTALIGIGQLYNFPFLILSIAALLLLFSRAVKDEIF